MACGHGALSGQERLADIGVLTVAGTAFWMVVVAVAVVMSAASGGADPDPDELARVAVPVGMLVAIAAVAGCIAAIVAICRGRARQWVPLCEQMVRDAATLPDTPPRAGRLPGQPGGRWAGPSPGI